MTSTPVDVPLFKVAMSERASADVAEVLQSGFVGQGPRVDEFESAIGDLLGVEEVISVNSATSGLHLALHLIRTGEGNRGPEEPNEVLTTALTCTATNWPILGNGLRIRWVDVDPATLNLDLADLERKLSHRTLAVVVVHWGGYPVDLDALRAVLDRAEEAHGVRPIVIEDCAHAWGSTLRSRPIGSFGNPAVFSFQAIKHLTCGDGGAIAWDDREYARRARLCRWYGIDRTASDRFRGEPDIAEFGFKFHMNDINAAIGLANIDLAAEHVARHRANATFFDHELANVSGVVLTERRAGFDSSFWIYTLLVDDRPGFVGALERGGIQVSQVHHRNDDHSCVEEFRSELPGLDSVANRMVCIPVGWWVDAPARCRIVELIRSGW